MGRYVARVGKYYAEMGDWVYDYLKQNQSEDYYKNFKFDVVVKNTSTNKKYDYEVPVLENFIELKKLRKYFEWSCIDKNCLYTWLFNSVIKKEELFVKIVLNTHWGSYPTNYKTYYLQSDLYEDVVLVEEEINSKVQIKNLEDLDWIFSKGLNIVWVDEFGNKY